MASTLMNGDESWVWQKKHEIEVVIENIMLTKLVACKKGQGYFILTSLYETIARNHWNERATYAEIVPCGNSWPLPILLQNRSERKIITKTTINKKKYQGSNNAGRAAVAARAAAGRAAPGITKTERLDLRETILLKDKGVKISNSFHGRFLSSECEFRCFSLISTISFPSSSPLPLSSDYPRVSHASVTDSAVRPLTTRAHKGAPGRETAPHARRLLRQ
ncbi:hypothetical protein EVAR_40083_1 [Eumeta japonica]|uniref:Uncharacterized protein n=1 Tax=Eumeta variegata TaxID=151549 RepID=A0A4C1X5Q8_EUMVA|nr:hypothetical protein EVAR_40083_1 [Eumeta japonica]